MFTFNVCKLTIIFCLHVLCTQTISVGPNNSSAYLLWNLVNLAIDNSQINQRALPQNRQYYQQYPPQNQINLNYPQNLPPYPNQGTPNFPQNYYQQYPTEINSNIPPNYYQQYLQEGYPPTSNYFNRYPPYPRPHEGFPLLPHGRPILPGIAQSFAEALDQIARNDKLQCVPRLLCELISGPNSFGNSKQLQLDPSNLLSGLKIDMGSLLGLLSAVNGPYSSPLLVFARAALLGYAHRKNSESCLRAFPSCPQHPDELVNYLNNYNGGFFRYFGGVRPNKPYHPNNYPENLLPNYYQQNLGPHYYSQKQQNKYYTQQYYKQNAKSQETTNKIKAERRIQNKLPLYQYSIYTENNSDENVQSVKFPSLNANDNIVQYGKAWKFPDSSASPPLFNYIDAKEEKIKIHRGSKKLRFGDPEDSIKFSNNHNTLNNYVSVPVIYPDRTGTGELVLDI